MELAPKSKQIQLYLERLSSKAKLDNHRYLVVFSGEKDWVTNTVDEQLKLLPACRSLIVSTRSLQIPGEISSPLKLKSYLGTETKRVVWDGFSGLNPDGIGTISGVLVGGGILFLMLPKLNELSLKPDPDYLRMCAEPEELSTFRTNFLKRMIGLVNSDDQVHLFEQHGSPASPLVIEESICPNNTLQTNEIQTTLDQKSVIEAIKSVSSGHRKRPLVIYADRGRGKSSALGLAAAQICQQHPVLITAPSKSACDTAFKHFQQQFLHGSSTDSACGFEFCAPDALVIERPPCHLLFVDEAAAIPSPILKQILETYPRVVFSTTIHGYEGNGQGFAIRFRKELDKLTPQWKSISMTQPIRWAENDPLERWIFELLLLNASFPKTVEHKPQIISALRQTDIHWHSQDQLSSRQALLEQIVALLVLAHYQTSPSDIRLILDHPKVHIGTISQNELGNTVLGVILLIEEGGVVDETLSRAIIEGRRRPRGQLVPQSLVSSTGSSEFLAHQTYRVMRIAVHPSHIQQGLGSKLLEAAENYASHRGADSLSTSFGFTSALIDFWSKNRFTLLRLGNHKDGASGAQSVIMMRSISTASQQLTDQVTQTFSNHFLFGLSRQHRLLPVKSVYSILERIPIEGKVFCEHGQTILMAYAHGFRQFEDSITELSQLLLNSIRNKRIRHLEGSRADLLIMRILQGRSIQSCIQVLKFSGKKQLEKELRASIGLLLAPEK